MSIVWIQTVFVFQSLTFFYTIITRLLWCYFHWCNLFYTQVNVGLLLYCCLSCSYSIKDGIDLDFVKLWLTILQIHFSWWLVRVYFVEEADDRSKCTDNHDRGCQCGSPKWIYSADLKASKNYNWLHVQSEKPRELQIIHYLSYFYTCSGLQDNALHQLY